MDIRRDHYTGLERQRVPYALPRIHAAAQEADILITIEQRLAGTPLSTRLPGLTTGQLEAVMQRYLTAAQALASIEMPLLTEATG
jgi:hypothetical protein